MSAGIAAGDTRLGDHIGIAVEKIQCKPSAVEPGQWSASVDTASGAGVPEKVPLAPLRVREAQKSQSRITLELVWVPASLRQKRAENLGPRPDSVARSSRSPRCRIDGWS